jgi:hypothetical protein
MYIHHAGTACAEEIPLKNEFVLSENYESGGAGLFSTVDDYMKIITATACGKILSQKGKAASRWQDTYSAEHSPYW